MVTIDSQSGFCFGVVNAIRKAEEELTKGETLYCLGDIVHNGQEVERLTRLGLKTIDHEQFKTLRNAKVLLRAHGEPPLTYEIARQNGIEIIDASCPVVRTLQSRIRKQYEQTPSAQIVIFGKFGHAEVVGLQGQTDNMALIIENIKDIDKIDFTRDIYLFSQTTKSVEEFRELVQAIEQRFRGRVFQWKDTICRQVANRSQHIQEFAAAHDLVIFVGGKKSSNAKVLYNLAHEANPNTLFVSNPEELPNVDPNLNIGICGATSTPLWLMEACAIQLTSSTR